MTNPFSNSNLDSLRAVTDTVRDVISAGNSVPEDYTTHVDDAVSEIETEAPKSNEDMMNIIKKHFDNASGGEPQDTARQKAFQRAVGQALSSNAAKKKWENH